MTVATVTRSTHPLTPDVIEKIEEKRREVVSSLSDLLPFSPWPSIIAYVQNRTSQAGYSRWSERIESELGVPVSQLQILHATSR